MKTRFNIVDVVIIFIIIASIAVGCFLYFRPTDSKEDDAKNTTKIRFVIEVRNLSEDAANSFKAAKKKQVEFGGSATGSGVIYDVEVVDYEKVVVNTEEGTVLQQKVPGRYTVNVTVESKVEKSETAYTSGKEIISVGRVLPFTAFGVGSDQSCYVIDLYEVK